MYKIVIADDEYIIHEGLGNAINWEQANCVIAGNAYDGVEAIQVIETIHPDILITDIRMPQMDGMELIEYSNKHFPNIKIILLSGYNDFVYAQQAVELGAFSYLLKPTNCDELLKVIDSAKKAIERDIAINDEYRRLKKHVENSMPILRENFLRNLLVGLASLDITESEMEEQKELYRIDVRNYAILNFQIDHYRKYMESVRENNRLFQRYIIRDICHDMIIPFHGSYFIEIEHNLFSIILNLTNEIISENDVAEKIKDKISELLDISVSFGISNRSETITIVKELFDQANDALRYKFYIGSGSIIYYSDIQDCGKFRANNYRNLYEELVKEIKTGNIENSILLVDQLFEEFKQSKESIDLIKNSCIELLSMLFSAFSTDFLLNCNINRENIYLGISDYDTIDGLKRFMVEMTEKLSSRVHLEYSAKNRNVINRIIEYMKNNYVKDIKLRDLSELVYMNPSYLSRLIKKECKQNFSDLLTKIRIDQAKELLKNFDLKIYEVSEMVGINDAKYFALIFKRITGMNPTEYRESLNDILSD